MVDNQHRKISGYRDLSEAEINLLNRVKEAEKQVLALHDEIKQFAGINHRSAAIAQTQLQTGFMWLARAVARPNGE